MTEEKIALIGKLLVFGTAVLLAWLALSVLFRLVTGRGLFGHPPKDTLYLDPHAYGRSLASELTEAKGVTFPLLLAVTSSEMVVRARFPATLFFMPEIFDLEHRIPLGQVSAQLARDSWSSPSVHLAWVDRSARERRMELHLRHGQALIDARTPVEGPSAMASASAV